jgi:hypothetical protein
MFHNMFVRVMFPDQTLPKIDHCWGFPASRRYSPPPHDTEEGFTQGLFFKTDLALRHSRLGQGDAAACAFVSFPP